MPNLTRRRVVSATEPHDIYGVATRSDISPLSQRWYPVTWNKTVWTFKTVWNSSTILYYSHPSTIRRNAEMERVEVILLKISKEICIAIRLSTKQICENIKTVWNSPAILIIAIYTCSQRLREFGWSRCDGEWKYCRHTGEKPSWYYNYLFSNSG